MRALPFFGAFSPALAVERETNGALGSFEVHIGAADAAGLARTASDIPEEEDQCAKLWPVIAERRHCRISEAADLRFRESVEVLPALWRLEPKITERVRQDQPVSCGISEHRTSDARRSCRPLSRESACSRPIDPGEHDVADVGDDLLRGV